MPKQKKPPAKSPDAQSEGGLGGRPTVWISKIVGHDRVDPDQLLANPLNYRRHPQHQRKSLKAAINEVGFIRSVTVNRRTGFIVDGHERVWQAMDIGQPWVDVEYVDLSPEEEAKAIATMDAIGELAMADRQLLDQLLVDVKTEDPSLNTMLDELRAAAIVIPEDWDGDRYPVEQHGEIIEDEVPLPPDEATTQPGDLWILGDHRLLCGDSSNPEHLDRLLDGATIQLVNTDPPYNVKVEPRSNNAIAAGLSSFAGPKHHQSLDLARHPEKSKPTGKKLRAKDRPLANDFVSDDAFDQLLDDWFGNMARVLEPGRGFYIWGGYANLGNYPPYLKKHGLYFSQGIVWDKQHPVLTRKDFMGAFEICFYGWREGAAHVYLGPNNATDLWHVKKVNPQSMIHLTEKPVELAARAMQYSSRPGENVLDLFGGSGSTLIGAEQTGRRAYLMELDQLYCDVIVQRWENLTGRKAVLAK